MEVLPPNVEIGIRVLEEVRRAENQQVMFLNYRQTSRHQQSISAVVACALPPSPWRTCEPEGH